jgi:hypothetical protein
MARQVDEHGAHRVCALQAFAEPLVVEDDVLGQEGEHLGRVVAVPGFAVGRQPVRIPERPVSLVIVPTPVVILIHPPVAPWAGKPPPSETRRKGPKVVR